MPWHKVENHADCPAGEPWAVVKDDDGEVEGCHATEAEADEQMAALYANEDDMDDMAGDAEALGGKPNEGTKKDKRLKRNKADGDATALELSDDDGEQYATWQGTLVVEGVETGDGREFATDALTWAEPPLTLRWKKEDAHGGDHDLTVAVGRIDRVWRDGNKIMGAGVVDRGSADGAECARRLGNQTLRGVSIDADDITDADVELVWPEPKEGDDEDDLLTLLFAMPEKMIFHAGRIRAATLCDIPAFVEAYIELTDAVEEPPLAASVNPPLVAEVTSDGPWVAAEHEARLVDRLPREAARQAYAWVDPSCDSCAVERADRRLLHHEVSDDGQVGPANLTACASGIGALQSGDVVPAEDRRAAYQHLAAHLRAAGLEPEPLNDDVEALVAHALADQWRPPKAWFQNPNLGQLVPIMVTEEGRVYGHAAQWNECHIGYLDACVMAPREAGHPYFLTGELTCDDGTTVAVGQITADTGHAPLYARATVAAEHYDNTGAVVADVTVGNDEHGIWVAGAVRPDATSARVHKLRASGQVSPDWRRIGGELRMVALLTVNGSGYQVPKARVASGNVQALVAAGTVNLGPRPLSTAELRKQALRVLRDELTRRVHPELEEV